LFLAKIKIFAWWVDEYRTGSGSDRVMDCSHSCLNQPLRQPWLRSSHPVATAPGSDFALLQQIKPTLSLNCNIALALMAQGKLPIDAATSFSTPRMLSNRKSRIAISNELSTEIATAILTASDLSPNELRRLKDIVVQVHSTLQQMDVDTREQRTRAEIDEDTPSGR
jgi:hypothetical protein